MPPTRKRASNNSYQAQLAHTLLLGSSREEAITFCLEHNWDGVLSILTNLNDGTSECRK